jgi:glycosyltransferase involved in cell wall biosynthesis
MKLTIFTPTYNRSKEIVGLYDSIKNNINKLNKANYVEWMIVDDGSKEDYSQFLNIVEETSNFKLNYLKKENGGKHTAFNYAIDKCDGDLFVCIDDDDRLVDGALDKIFELGEKYIDKGYGAFVGRVADVNNTLLGKTIFSDELVSDTIEIRDKYGFWGEPEIYFVPVLKKYRFDVFEDERFLTEAYLFDKMSKDYPFVYTNDVLMIKEYLAGGLTDNSVLIRIKSPNGAVAYYLQRQKMSKGKAKIKSRINKLRFNYWLPKNKKIKKSFIDLVFSPVAFMMYRKDKKIIK